MNSCSDDDDDDKKSNSDDSDTSFDLGYFKNSCENRNNNKNMKEN